MFEEMRNSMYAMPVSLVIAIVGGVSWLWASLAGKVSWTKYDADQQAHKLEHENLNNKIDDKLDSIKAEQLYIRESIHAVKENMGKLAVEKELTRELLAKIVGQERC